MDSLNRKQIIDEIVSKAKAQRSLEKLPFAIQVAYDENVHGSFVVNNTHDPQNDVEINDYEFYVEYFDFACTSIEFSQNKIQFRCTMNPALKTMTLKEVAESIFTNLMCKPGIDEDIEMTMLLDNSYEYKLGIDPSIGEVLIENDRDPESGQRFAALGMFITTPSIDVDDSAWANYTGMQRWHQEQKDLENMANDRHFEDEIDEEDGGGAAAGGDAGGDAGGASSGDSSSASNVGDVAAEMNGAGITTTDVLGDYKPGKGFMGDNFYLPFRAKCPMHHWEIANGGSKRKRSAKNKNKKYSYEKGMKVVVDMLEDEEMLNEFFAQWTLEELRGKTWQQIVDETKDGSKKPLPPYDRWVAAQLPLPQEEEHGRLGGCIIVEGEDPDNPYADYLNKYYIHGFYKDGTKMELGPMKRGVASQYINLHGLSVDKRRYEELKAQNDAASDKSKSSTGLYNVKEINPEKKDGGAFVISKFPDGFYLKQDTSDFRVGPFETKALARKYAFGQKYEMATLGKKEKAAKAEHVRYPTFVFTYDFRNTPCADIVVAEDAASAMKLFDFQWHVFLNMRPTRASFKTLKDLKDSLLLCYIKNIQMTQLNTEDEVDDWEDICDQTKNPMSNPSLQHWCKNPKFKYILGRNKTTGRSPVVITWGKFGTDNIASHFLRKDDARK